MTEREKFEQWAQMPERNWDVSRWRKGYGSLGGLYRHPWVQGAWIAWQAGADASTHKAIYEDEA